MFSTSEQENQLRLFELQSVSAAAMRLVLDEMPDPFQNKIKQLCRSLPRFQDKKRLLLGIYAVFYFNILQYLLLIYDFYVGT